jgi:hypothetical protein
MAKGLFSAAFEIFVSLVLFSSFLGLLKALDSRFSKRGLVARTLLVLFLLIVFIGIVFMLHETTGFRFMGRRW